MAREWMSLTHAASVLGMSVKTLHMRIEELGYETKIKNGKRYVAVEMSSTSATQTLPAGKAADGALTPSQSAKRQLARLAETRASLHQKQLVRDHDQDMKIAQGAIVGWQQAAKQAVNSAEQREAEVRFARKQSIVSLSVAAVVFVLLSTVGVWAAYAVTRTSDTLAHQEERLLSEKRLNDAVSSALTDTRGRLNQTEAQLAEMRSHLEDARLHAVEMAKAAAAAEREAKVLREHLRR